MEKEEVRCARAPEADFLQWGSRKRPRCFKVKKGDVLRKSDGSPFKRSAASRLFRSENDAAPQSDRKRRSDSPTQSESRRLLPPSPDKEDRYYTTRGSLFEDGSGKVLMEGVGEDKGFVWPKFFVALSSKEKEEDFMAMKGCKLPQRPKKRAKLVQKTILLVCPGTWLSDLSHERYEVREKKSSKKRPRGLKAMRSMESDSD